jgi:hypothetical protein
VGASFLGRFEDYLEPIVTFRREGQEGLVLYGIDSYGTERSADCVEPIAAPHPRLRS